MATSCGPLTFLCVFVLLLVAASLALAGSDAPDDHVADTADVALERDTRSVGHRGGSRGNERVAVDSVVSSRRGGGGGGGRRGNRQRNRGNAGGGRRRNNRRRGQSRRRRPAFTRKERVLIGRLAGANAAFTLNMYNKLREGNPELVFSPHSIHTALTMTFLGARDRTAKQMGKVLGLKGLKRMKAHTAYSALTNSLNNASNITLNTANAVYVKPNLPIEQAFRTSLQSYYQADFGLFDFNAEGGPEVPINSWVAMKTEDKIRDLLAAGTITPLTAMIIINAIYFKGNWKDKFDVADTMERTFYQDGGSTVPVQMMSRTANYNYTVSAEMEAHVVEIPYEGDRFSMYLVVPQVRNTLSQVESRLTMEGLNQLLGSMRSVRVELSLPRFKSESKFSLKDTLKTMGMTVPFNQRRASFTGICSVQDLFISDVIHQAVVEVNEVGTEAAAATGVIIGLRSFPQRSIIVNADHPFIYAIRDKLTRVWLFMGKYTAAQ